MSKETKEPVRRDKTKLIIASIEGEVEHKIRGMEEVFTEKLRAMRSQNEKEKAEALSIISKEKDRSLALLENRMMAEADLSARRLVENAKEGVMQKSLQQVSALLRKEVEASSAAYKEFIKRKGEEAKRLLPSGSTVEMVKGDKASITLSSMGFEVKDTLPATVIGGALFHAPDGKKHLDSTLGHLIQRDIVDIRTTLSKDLFTPATKKEELE